MSVAVGDVEPPAPPTGLVATPVVRDVQLTWNASPEPDVVGYVVLRDGVRIGEAPSPAYLDPGLPNATYVYTVIAVDEADLESGESAPATAVIDVQPVPPAAPVILEPTDAAHPVTLQASRTDVAGAADAGTVVALEVDGQPRGSALAEPGFDRLSSEVVPGSAARALGRRAPRGLGRVGRTPSACGACRAGTRSSRAAAPYGGAACCSRPTAASWRSAAPVRAGELPLAGRAPEPTGRDGARPARRARPGGDGVVARRPAPRAVAVRLPGGRHGAGRARRRLRRADGARSQLRRRHAPAVVPGRRQDRLRSGPGTAHAAELRVLEVASGRSALLDEQPSPDAPPSWSPDGRRLAWTSAERAPLVVRVYDLDTESVSLELGEPGADVLDARFSPDGDWLSYVRVQAVEGGDPLGSLRAREERTGRAVTVVEAQGAWTRPEGHDWVGGQLALEAAGLLERFAAGGGRFVVRDVALRPGENHLVARATDPVTQLTSPDSETVTVTVSEDAFPDLTVEPDGHPRRPRVPRDRPAGAALRPGAQRRCARRGGDRRRDPGRGSRRPDRARHERHARLGAVRLRHVGVAPVDARRARLARGRGEGRRVRPGGGDLGGQQPGGTSRAGPGRRGPRRRDRLRPGGLPRGRAGVGHGAPLQPGPSLRGRRPYDGGGARRAGGGAPRRARGVARLRGHRRARARRGTPAPRGRDATPSGCGSAPPARPCLRPPPSACSTSSPASPSSHGCGRSPRRWPKGRPVAFALAVREPGHECVARRRDRPAARAARGHVRAGAFRDRPGPPAAAPPAARGTRPTPGPRRSPRAATPCGSRSRRTARCSPRPPPSSRSCPPRPRSRARSRSRPPTCSPARRRRHASRSRTAAPPPCPAIPSLVDVVSGPEATVHFSVPAAVDLAVGESRALTLPIETGGDPAGPPRRPPARRNDPRHPRPLQPRGSRPHRPAEPARPRERREGADRPPVARRQQRLEPGGRRRSPTSSQLFGDEPLTQPLPGATGVAETPSRTSWPVAARLAEDTTYWWRARATDGFSTSAWSAVASFTVDAVNRPPTAPVPDTPAPGARVASRQPALIVRNALDPERQPLTYEFRLAADEGMSQVVAAEAGLAEGLGLTSWTVTTLLDEDAVYYWSARARTAGDAPEDFSPWSVPVAFRVDTVNLSPTAPRPLRPIGGAGGRDAHAVARGRERDRPGGRPADLPVRDRHPARLSTRRAARPRPSCRRAPARPRGRRPSSSSRTRSTTGARTRATATRRRRRPWPASS